MSSPDRKDTPESVHHIMRYLRFAGFDLTSDQIVRLHRRRLINRPVAVPKTIDSANARYPAGTAERVLRILQLRSATKELDELTWRLWWEGFHVEPDLIRAFLFRRARLWDEQLSEHGDTDTKRDDSTSEERDVLDDVFFKHLKSGPTNASAHRQLQRGTALFTEFAGLLRDLEHGDPFAKKPRRDPLGDEWLDTRDSSSRSLTRDAEWVSTLTNVPYTKMVDAIEDDDFKPARRVTRHVLASIATVGGIVHDVFGSSGRVRDNVGKSLVTMSESPNEQVLAFLLTTSLRRDHRVRFGLIDADEVAIAPPPISYHDFQRLDFLIDDIPELAPFLEAERVKGVFASPAFAEEWRSDLDDFRHRYLLEFEMAIDLESELFDEESPPGEKSDDHFRFTTKKKILNDAGD